MSGVMQIQLRKKSDGLGKTRICNTLERPASVHALVGILRTVKNFSKPASRVRRRALMIRLVRADVRRTMEMDLRNEAEIRFFDSAGSEDYNDKVVNFVVHHFLP